MGTSVRKSGRHGRDDEGCQHGHHQLLQFDLSVCAHFLIILSRLLLLCDSALIHLWGTCTLPFYQPSLPESPTAVICGKRNKKQVIPNLLINYLIAQLMLLPVFRRVKFHRELEACCDISAWLPNLMAK